MEGTWQVSSKSDEICRRLVPIKMTFVEKKNKFKNFLSFFSPFFWKKNFFKIFFWSFLGKKKFQNFSKFFRKKNFPQKIFFEKYFLEFFMKKKNIKNFKKILWRNLTKSHFWKNEVFGRKKLKSKKVRKSYL